MVGYKKSLSIENKFTHVLQKCVKSDLHTAQSLNASEMVDEVRRGRGGGSEFSHRLSEDLMFSLRGNGADIHFFILHTHPDNTSCGSHHLACFTQYFH